VLFRINTVYTTMFMVKKHITLLASNLSTLYTYIAWKEEKKRKDEVNVLSLI
jgi:hypothetical protein